MTGLELNGTKRGGSTMGYMKECPISNAGITDSINIYIYYFFRMLLNIPFHTSLDVYDLPITRL